MDEWTRQRLGRVLELVIDHRGKTPKKLESDWADTGHRVISAINIQDSQVSENNYRYVDVDTYMRWMKVPLQPGDVILSSEAPLGRVAYIAEKTEWVLGQRVFGLRVNPRVLLGNFLFHWLQTSEAQQALRGRATGTTVLGIKRSELVNIEILVPPLDVQSKISQTLGALTDKLSVNQKIISRAIDLANAFHEHGVQACAGPVVALNEFVGALFPGDWGADERTAEFTVPAFCVRGSDLDRVRAGRQDNMPVRYLKEKSSQRRALKAGDIIVEGSGGSPTQCTGRAAHVDQKFLDALKAPLVTSNFCKTLRVEDIRYSAYVYMSLMGSWRKGELWSYESGTTGIKNLNLQQFLVEKTVPILSTDQIRDYNERIGPLLQLIQQLGQENNSLRRLQEFIRPRLMDGTLAVRSAERFVREAV